MQGACEANLKIDGQCTPMLVYRRYWWLIKDVLEEMAAYPFRENHFPGQILWSGNQISVSKHSQFGNVLRVLCI
jgi:hypothetical protein